MPGVAPDHRSGDGRHHQGRDDADPVRITVGLDPAAQREVVDRVRPVQIRPAEAVGEDPEERCPTRDDSDADGENRGAARHRDQKR